MPKVISLPKDSYENMVRVMKLPFRAIETSAVVGPFFWCAYDQDDENPHLRMLPLVLSLSASLVPSAHRAL